MFNIEFKKYGAIVVATVHTTQVVDSTKVRDMGDEVIAYIEDHPDSHVLLNFTKVDYMSSAMLSEILKINEVMRRQRGSIRICGLRKEMREVFHITKLDDIFHIEDDCRACLKRYHDDVTKRAQQQP